MFALVDANAFYCSCERVFQPKLEGRPVVVLSNNDGCVVSRTDEAKAKGIAMGEVWHLARPELKAGVHAFSSNYTLYGDMSRRVVLTLRARCEHIEEYSIDESFLHYDSAGDWSRLGREICQTVRNHTGIPVCVGFGPTKVLAKLANRIAKQTAASQGVFCWPTSAETANALLETRPVSDVWGIGRRLSARLATLGVLNARQLRDLDDPVALRVLAVTGLRIVWELRGVSCLELEEIAPPKKAICCAKGFGQTLSTYEALLEPLATYVSRVAAKLRAQKLVAGHLQVFLETNPHGAGPSYNPGIGQNLDTSTHDTAILNRIAAHLLHTIHRPGLVFRKVGVLVTDLSPETEVQLGFDAPTPESMSKRAALFKACDKINRHYGRDTLRPASAGVGRAPSWRMRQSRLSPCYTTRWPDLLTVSA